MTEKIKWDIKKDLKQYIQKFNNNKTSLVFNFEAKLSKLGYFLLLPRTQMKHYLCFEKHGENLSLRYSKYEGIDTVQNFIGKVKWVWVDTYEDFDLDSKTASILSNFNLCLVSPTRWGYENKTNYYQEKFKKYDLSFDAIMIDHYKEG